MLERSKRRRKLKKDLDTDITSLMDIMITLLFFLITVFNASGVAVNVIPNLFLPNSKTQNLNSDGVTVQVSQNELWVDDKLLLSIEPGQGLMSFVDSQGKIDALYNELQEKRLTVKTTEKMAQSAKEFSGVANLVIDKEYSYSTLRHILHTVALAGFVKYKLIVLNES